MSSLLATKLHRPSIPAKRVQRPQLIQHLNEGFESGRQMTLVSAPAGFGKTTCISEWVNGLDLPVTWLSLDPTDDDPGRFFTYLVAALQKVDANTNLGREIEGVLRSGQVQPHEVQTQHPHAQRLMMPFKNRPAQVIELVPTRLAFISLTMSLVGIISITRGIRLPKSLQDVSTGAS